MTIATYCFVNLQWTEEAQHLLRSHTKIVYYCHLLLISASAFKVTYNVHLKKQHAPNIFPNLVRSLNKPDVQQN